jgi:hypothetical protein
MIKENHLQIMIPDYELYSCKEIFEFSTCHESFFGMSRLHAYEGKFYKALESINYAIETQPDPIYKLWQCVLTVKTTKKIEEIQTHSFLQSLLCCSPNRSMNKIIELLQNIEENEETL